MSATPHASSYYAASANDKVERPRLESSIETDVCIIGAGYTGLSSALHLLESGMKVVILEAARIGWGASGRNGGQIVNSFSRDIDSIEKVVGKEQGKLFGQMAFEGGQIIRERIAKYNIDCDLKDGGVFAAMNAKQMGHLQSQKKLWEAHGHHNHLEMLDHDGIRNVVNSDLYVGGLLDKSGGHIHPLNLALGEARAVESLGGQIFEDSAVINVDDGESPIVHTAQGQVKCKFVVVAGNAYLGKLLPELQAACANIKYLASAVPTGTVNLFEANAPLVSSISV